MGRDFSANIARTATNSGPPNHPSEADHALDADEHDYVKIALYDCAFSGPPSLVDGDYDQEQEMAEMADQVRQYLQTIQASLDRITAVEVELEDRLSDEHRRMVNFTYNNGVDQMTIIAEEYNKRVQQFRRANRISEGFDGVDHTWDP